MSALEELFAILPYMDDYATKDLGEHFYFLADKANKELAAKDAALAAMREVLVQVTNLEDEDGGRSFPPRTLIQDAREALAALPSVKP